MPYKYAFDTQLLGDFAFSVEAYRSIHHGLLQLLLKVEKWNEKVSGADAAPPYERERDDLKGITTRMSERLAEKRPIIREPGLSVGTMRYFRAGIELILRWKREELKKNRAERWPSAAIESLERSLEKMVNEFASLPNVPPTDLLWEVLLDNESQEIVSQIRSKTEQALWDAFICHASEDKDAFVRRLAEALQKAGLRIWYDEFSLQVGDRLRRSIDKGLSGARYGIVILSPNFFAKEWPQKELDGLVAREDGGEKVILPVWHNVDIVAVRQYSPTLSDRVATRSENGLDRVVQELLAVLNQTG